MDNGSAVPSAASAPDAPPSHESEPPERNEVDGRSAGEPDAPPQKNWWRKHRIKLILSLILGGGLGWAVSQGGLPLLPPRSAFDAVPSWVIPAYLAVMGVVHTIRALRWRHLLRPLGKVRTRDVLSVSWVSFAIILLSPLRSGEVARPYLITRRSSIRWWEATGTIGAERVIDGLMLSGLLFFGLQLSTPQDPLPDHIGGLPVPVGAVPGAAYSALILFVSAFIVMAVFYFARDFARRLTLKVVGVVSERAAVFLADAVERVAMGLSFLPSARTVVPFVLETAAYWLINAAGVLLLLKGCGIHDASFAHACVAMGSIGIGILVPAGPGYFGAFQFSAFMALAMFFSESVLTTQGAVFVFLLYVCQVGWHVLGALIGIGISPAAPRPRENLAAEQDADEATAGENLADDGQAS